MWSTVWLRAYLMFRKFIVEHIKCICSSKLYDRVEEHMTQTTKQPKHVKIPSLLKALQTQENELIEIKTE